MPADCRWLSVLAGGLRLALVATAFGLASVMAADSEVRKLEARRTEDGYVVDLVMWVPAPREQAFAVLVDFEHMPEWVPNLRQSRVVRRGANRVTIEHQGVARYGILTVPFTTLREIEFAAPDWMRAIQLAGTMKRHESRMDFVSEDAGTRIDYHVEMVPGGFAGLVMSKQRVESELREHFEAIGAEILRRGRAARSGSRDGQQGGRVRGAAGRG